MENILKFATAGQFLKLKTSSILLVAGSWSLAALILTNYYNTLLISYVSAPNPKPLIKSIRDLRDRPDIFLVTDKNANTDGLLSVIYVGLFLFIHSVHDIYLP